MSVVTPSYNQGEFIGKTIESVLSQTGDFEIEYFVMDGGSTDDSAAIIADYARQVAAGIWSGHCAGIRMQWVSRRDRGQTDALNQGLRRTTGDFVGWINSDDAYVPGAFGRIVGAFAANAGADFVYGDGEVIDAQGMVQWNWLARPYNLRLLTSYHFLWNDFTNYVMQQSTFWRRDVMARIGYLDEAFDYGMDIEYWVRAGAAGLTLHHIAEPVGRFRLIAGTKSLSSPTAFWPDYLEIFRRHRGVRHLTPFFAFYYYNLARELQFDAAGLTSAREDVLGRWNALPPDERRRLRLRAERGFALGCLLAARDRLMSGDRDRAAAFVEAAGGVSWREWLHPISWAYGARRWLTPGASAAVESVVCAGVRQWRRRVIDYRYHRPATHMRAVLP